MGLRHPCSFKMLARRGLALVLLDQSYCLLPSRSPRVHRRAFRPAANHKACKNRTICSAPGMPDGFALVCMQWPGHDTDSKRQIRGRALAPAIDHRMPASQSCPLSSRTPQRSLSQAGRANVSRSDTLHSQVNYRYHGTA